MHLFTLALIALSLITSTCALSTVRTYRGQSLYQAMYKDAKPTPVFAFPDPKSSPEFYSHQYLEGYQRQGLGVDEVPKWAQSIIQVLENVVDFLVTSSSLLSPYFYSTDQIFVNAPQFTFKSIGDDDYSDLKQNSTRVELKKETVANPNLPADSGFDYKNDKVRGVNIGNWLLFELWMDSTLSAALNNHAINAPGPNSIVDEWTAGLYSDYNWASQVLRKHFDTWITEADFIAIKAAGLNHVRIPFPYWGFAEAVGPNAPYLTLNRFDKLIEACGWAKSLGLKVWVDIHGVPGSQNGFDNSGHQGPINWANNRDYYTRTQYTFNRLASLFSQPEWKGTVTAVEAVNEPAANQNDGVASLINEYYPWARDAVAHPPNSTEITSLLLAMHDGFLGPLHWEGFITGTRAHRVLLDTHSYFVYSDQQKAAGDTVRIREVCAMEDTLRQSQNNYPTITGEWSVNGPNGDQASNRDLPNAPFSFPDGPAYPYSKRYMAFMARNFAVQTATFEKGSGWLFWAWKNRNHLDWSYQAGLQYGWIPVITGANTPWSRFGNDPCASFR